MSAIDQSAMPRPQPGREKPPATAPVGKKPYPFWLGGESSGVSRRLLACFGLAWCGVVWLAAQRTELPRIDFRLGAGADSVGVAASIAGSCTHPLDLTKVRLQTSGDKGMFNSIKKTVHNNGESLRALGAARSHQELGVICGRPNHGLRGGWLTRSTGIRGLYDGLTGTLLRQMTYSMMRFAAYDWAKGVVHTGKPSCHPPHVHPDPFRSTEIEMQRSGSRLMISV